MGNKLLLSLCLLAACSKPRELVDAKILIVSSTDSAWACGDQGYTIVELTNKTRVKLCGQFGNPGDTFKISSKYLR